MARPEKTAGVAPCGVLVLGVRCRHAASARLSWCADMLVIVDSACDASLGLQKTAMDAAAVVSTLHTLAAAIEKRALLHTTASDSIFAKRELQAIQSIRVGCAKASANAPANLFCFVS